MKENKKGAIELSIGTIVIIVLAMSMLILGLVLVRTIFTGAIDAVKSIDDGVKKEIGVLFSENNERRVVLYPDAGLTRLKQGSTGLGFAIAIRNTGSGGGTSTFTYSVAPDDNNIRTKCNVQGIDLDPTVSWARIDAGQSLISGIVLSTGQSMTTPLHVRFTIRDDAPICMFRLKVVTLKDGLNYDTSFMDVEIVPS